MNKRNQVIRDGNKTLRRIVHKVSASGRGGFIERGYVEYGRRWFVVNKTKPMTWWKLGRPARAEEELHLSASN
jgi:hypothetical protein